MKMGRLGSGRRPLMMCLFPFSTASQKWQNPKIFLSPPASFNLLSANTSQIKKQLTQESQPRGKQEKLQSSFTIQVPERCDYPQRQQQP